MEKAIDLYSGDCLGVLRGIADNSIDSIVTDPPYGLKFMGKKWDYSVPSVKVWRECFRVLKPGGHLLSFAGTRTQHRMCCNIEDAGFEIRDMLAWIYGCLSEDTEILTSEGWMLYNKDIIKSSILCYDIEEGVFSFHQPIRDYFYVNKHTAYRIHSNNTDQIVSRGHRVIVEREGRGIFVKSEELKTEEDIPFLESLFDLPETIYDHQSHTSIQKCDLLKKVHKRVFEKKAKRGCFGEVTRKVLIEDRMCSSCQPQYFGQQHWESNVVSKQSRAQVVRRTRAKIESIEYSGNVWCVEVPTGAFVARRNGKIFITGNSGFPKSMDISKAIDKGAGAEREVVGQREDILQKQASDIRNGKRKYVESLNLGASTRNNGFVTISADITAPATEEAKEWEGWGTALKPALEPITMARKPISEDTIAENVLKWGTGGINIDECRVETGEVVSNHSRGMESAVSKGKYGDSKEQETHQTNGQKLGRFPANLIHDGSEEVLELFPITTSGAMKREVSGYDGDGVTKFLRGKSGPSNQHGDSGSAARFFYCAKASKKERNEGCTEDNPNTHPTVKPIALMRYLCKLVTPKNGIILDPFMGSGSTGVAAKAEGFGFMGIELEESSFLIAKARIFGVMDTQCE